MKNLFIYKIICSIMVLSIICSCSSDNVLNMEEPEVPARGNDMIAGPGCPYHLGICPEDCFSGGGYHQCLNPDHMGMQEYISSVHGWDQCKGCRLGDNGPGGPGDPGIPTLPEVPGSKFCNACKECQACIHIRKYVNDSGDGMVPYQPYQHSCGAERGTCSSCICCKQSGGGGVNN